jgi:6-phosphofructokinase 1
VRVAITTGGGDAPGLNAVIRAVVLAGLRRGWELFGIRKGFAGLLDGDGPIPLGQDQVRGITHLGGTILGTTNRGNPFAWPETTPDGQVVERDRSGEVVAAFRAHKLDALIVVGGDGTLGIGLRLWQLGVPVIGVPKTIDNDVGGTVITFGFDTAVTTATESLDKLHPTAEAHERVFVVEVMGRHAGWIALHSGIAATADAILLPEIPYDLDSVVAKIKEREEGGRRFAIIVVAEGAVPRDGVVTLKEAQQAGRAARLGGVAERVAEELGKRTGKETRTLTLGHLQRGGSPTTFDRLLALRFGAAAVRGIAEKRFGQMVALQPPSVVYVPITEALKGTRTVPLDSDVLRTARDLGICLGE